MELHSHTFKFATNISCPGTPTVEYEGHVYNTVQGICPPGWHSPTDEEWKVLEGAVDSQYGIGDPEWDISWDYRGYNAGKNLKATSGWYENGNGTDLFGFSVLPGGGRYDDSYFYGASEFGYWWVSTENGYYYGWHLYFNYNSPKVRQDFVNKDFGYSIRCLLDD